MVLQNRAFDKPPRHIPTPRLCSYPPKKGSGFRMRRDQRSAPGSQRLLLLMRLNLNRQIKLKIRELRIRTPHFHSCPLLLLFLCFLAVSLFAPKLLAQNKPAPATAMVSDNRFLFIVDTSASMERHAREVQQQVSDILSSSASGQMHRGDTLGVWTFNSEVYTGTFPLQRWSPGDWWPIASHITEFLQQQHYGKKSRFDKALADMYEVITNSDILTIFLISNGEGKMQGTPFDAEINAAYKESLKEMKKDRMPIITVLQAKSGKIIKYTVTAFPWPVVVPEVPIAIKKVQAPPVRPASAAVPQNSAATNRPDSTAPAATTPPLATQPAPPSAPQQNPIPPAATPAPVVNVLPQPTPAQVVPAVVAQQPVNPGSPSLPPSSPAAVATPFIPMPKRQFRPPPPAPVVNATPVPSTAASIASPPPAIPSAPVIQAAPVRVQPAVTATSPVSSPKPVQVAQAAPSPSASAPPSANSPAAQAVAVIPANASSRPKFFLIAGITLVLIALGIIALLVRRARTSSGPSLISTSMDNRK